MKNDLEWNPVVSMGMGGFPFLELPAELRLKIYDFVLHSYLGINILDDELHDTERIIVGPSGSVMSAFKYQVAWPNLKLTCRTIADELESLMNDEVYLRDAANRTYAMDLEVFQGVEEFYKRQATWRSLPCHPFETQKLSVNVFIRNSLWSQKCGWPLDLARWLCRLWKRFLYSGPRMKVLVPLQSELKLQKVSINLTVLTNFPHCQQEPSFDALRNTTGDALQVNGSLRLSAESGSLQPHLEKVKVRICRTDDECVWTEDRGDFPELEKFNSSFLEDVNHETLQTMVFFGESLSSRWLWGYKPKEVLYPDQSWFQGL